MQYNLNFMIIELKANFKRILALVHLPFVFISWNICPARLGVANTITNTSGALALIIRRFALVLKVLFTCKIFSDRS